MPSLARPRANFFETGSLAFRPSAPSFFAAVLAATPVSTQTLSDPAKVIDGDSMSVPGISVHLFGIDAPEGKQTCNRSGTILRCGEEAATQFCNRIGRNPIECRDKNVDT